ncbi:protein CMSS1 isoform X1 [Pseudoliparis swirei]|uniref:protein CMSS1 isoform X1 n=1 Tax=Pseudoliparis swirei TaxID=2059687 RepID=UPI0024BE6FAB|nr:protein CMSS1 isoform X1 [Pseudoliparis swirei]
MGDDLGDEWWAHEGNSGASEAEAEEEKEVKKEVKKPQAKRPTGKITKKTQPEKRKSVTEETVKAKKKKTEPTACGAPQKRRSEDEDSKPKRKRKKKTITDVLASSEPRAGAPADLQALVMQHFSDKLSVIEQEELMLPDSCFLSSNDLTHTVSSYLKQVCPKWSKIHKQHAAKSSVVLLVVCGSALRAIELIKQMTAFKGDAKALKLFAKHIKIEEQVKLLQKGVTHIGVGTPGRIGTLIENEGLSLQALKYVVLDWNWRDQKLRRMVDVPEVKLDLLKLLQSRILTACKGEKIKIGLF